MNKFLVAWYHGPRFGKLTLLTPWWAVVDTKEGIAVYAAIEAVSAEEAQQTIAEAYRPAKSSHSIEWLFVQEKSDSWYPFCDRFPREYWMEWSEKELVR